MFSILYTMQKNNRIINYTFINFQLFLLIMLLQLRLASAFPLQLLCRLRKESITVAKGSEVRWLHKIICSQVAEEISVQWN